MPTKWLRTVRGLGFWVDVLSWLFQGIHETPRTEAMSHNPTEHVQEEIHHHASLGGHGNGAKWITAAATSAAFAAAFAAAAGAMATSHLIQSTLIRIQANDDWSFYQAKSIKTSILDAKIYSAQLSQVEPRKADVDKIAEYAKEMPEVQREAREFEKLSTEHLETHETYEGAATLFHIAIAIVAVSVVAKRKEFWLLSMIIAVIGIFFFAKAFLNAPARPKKEEPVPASAAANPSAHEHGTAKASASAEHSAQKSPETNP